MSLSTFRDITLKCPYFFTIALFLGCQYANSKISRSNQNFKTRCKIVELITDRCPIGLHQALYPQFVNFSGKLLNINTFFRKIIKICFEVGISEPLWNVFEVIKCHELTGFDILKTSPEQDC